MQCTSCHFENMPGVEACGRCGSSLRLASAVIDVHPPRAQPWVKSLRRWLPWRAKWIGLRDAAAQAGQEAAQRMNMRLPALEVLARTIVPGWNHFHNGQVMRGRFFLGSYLFLLVAGLILFGTGLGSVLLGLAFAVHAGSILDVLFPGAESWGLRLTQSALVYFLLALVLYLPAGWLLTRVAYPMPIETANRPLMAGDVLLCNQWAHVWSAPRPGELVAYRTHAAQFDPMYAGDVATVFHEGTGIDRVLAGPGTRVLWEKGVLSADGQPVAWRPLNPESLPARLEIEVGDGRFLILPTTSPYFTPQTPANVWRRMSLVREDDIRGRVYFRHQPLSRWGIIR